MATKSSTGRTAASKAANRSTATTKKKTAVKKKKSAGRKYSPEASGYVEKEMKEMKQGKLKSGSSGKKVRNPKQAIAIGLSEARKAGAKVPANPRRKAA
jgi:hypothetical protein